MKVGFYMNCVSAHQLPLACEIAKRVGADNFVYVDAGLEGQGFQTVPCDEPWISTDKSKLDECDVVLTGIRDFELFERRQRRGLATFYTSERWFKPISIGVGSRCRCSVPGWVRMLVPSYRKMALRFVQLIKSDDNLKCLPIGPWARKDFKRMGVKSEKMIDWGYFVAPSSQPSTINLQPLPTKRALRVLWVGRMLYWKRVDTIIKAARKLPDIMVTIIGDGPERRRLEKMAKGCQNIEFKKPMSISQVRAEMRNHDVYVLASNEEEGWGAALSEALEEGMMALGTFEAGASSALLGNESLYHAGDVIGLRRLLSRCRSNRQYIECKGYTCEEACSKLFKVIQGELIA